MVQRLMNAAWCAAVKCVCVSIVCKVQRSFDVVVESLLRLLYIVRRYLACVFICVMLQTWMWVSFVRRMPTSSVIERLGRCSSATSTKPSARTCYETRSASSDTLWSVPALDTALALLFYWVRKKLKGSPFQSYRASSALRDHTVLSATQCRWTHLTSTLDRQAGLAGTYLPTLEGWKAEFAWGVSQSSMLSVISHCITTVSQGENDSNVETYFTFGDIAANYFGSVWPTFCLLLSASRETSNSLLATGWVWQMGQYFY